jgi:tetratricopeptide (TPR) repeat protein
LLQGKNEQAEPMLRALQAVLSRVLGAENPETLKTAGDLASSLAGQGKFVDAERINREVLRVLKRVLGAEHHQTLKITGNLAMSLSYQGKHTEAEAMKRELLGVQKRVLGEEHLDTLLTTGNLAMSLLNQDKHAEAETMQRELLRVQKRVLGSEHPDTLTTANNLASTLLCQGQHAEAGRMLQAVLASRQRTFGPTHPSTLQTAQDLHEVREFARTFENVRAYAQSLEAGKANIGAKPPTKTPSADTLATGTRVLVQRLVAKPEHNGKRAQVLSFDACNGRYTVALDDGKQLSLRPECVARFGCAAAGCASEEASNMCGRCQAVRYCSRECQRMDWKAHKPACMAPHTA